MNKGEFNLDLSPYAAVLLDLDGTVYHEEQALPGAIELIRNLQYHNRKFACLTNSTSSPQRLTRRLAGMGVNVDPTHIYTAAAASADYVLERFGAAGRVPRVFNLSSEGLQEMLDSKVYWVRDPSEQCDAVICGVTLNLYATEERQRTAMLLLRQGSGTRGNCADRIYPSPRGLEFGVGAMAAMLAYAADVAPFSAASPERIFFDELCHRLDVHPANCVLIGDNLESDIAGGKNAGMRTILCLTGLTRAGDIDRLPVGRRPDGVIPDLRAAGGMK